MKQNPRPVLDPATLERLASETGGADVVRQIVGLYLDEMPSRLSALAQGVEGGRESLHRTTHSLRSSSALLGARSLEGLCAVLESEAREASVQDVDEMVAGVRACAEVTTRALLEWLARLG
ncbi:MAG: Hpt domain-containing protein [Actinomycetota bacterium]|nr:Hpt domain-containing protein [Actinomycetota bacterium]